MKSRMSERRNPDRIRRLPLALAILMLGVAGVVAAIAFFPPLTPDLTGPPERAIPGAPDRPERTAVVATDVLNVREAASVDSAILAALPNGQPVKVVGDPVNGFLPVAYGTGRAWMAAEYLSVGEESIADGWRSPVIVQDIDAVDPKESDLAAVDPVVAPMTDGPDPASGGPDMTAPHLGDDPAPASEDGWTSDERWIEVDRDTATVILHDGTTIVETFHGKVGGDPSDDGYYSTALGTFHVYSMSKELTETPFAEDVYLTDWVGFDPERNNGFHSPVRDASGAEQAAQNPTTLGCVRLDAAAAEEMFAFAYIGMRVEIHE